MSTGGDKDCVGEGTQDSIFIGNSIFCGVGLTQNNKNAILMAIKRSTPVKQLLEVAFNGV